jgi:hypothetical protein
VTRIAAGDDAVIANHHFIHQMRTSSILAGQQCKPSDLAASLRRGYDEVGNNSRTVWSFA